jgi:hypothetical protein
MSLRSINSAPTTGATTAATVAALASTLGVAAACWVVAVDQMDGMDMGVASELDSGAQGVDVRRHCRGTATLLETTEGRRNDSAPGRNA